MESACGHRAWLLPNVACNSHGNLSRVEARALQLQRFWGLVKSGVGELHATLREGCRSGFWGALGLVIAVRASFSLPALHCLDLMPRLDPALTTP